MKKLEGKLPLIAFVVAAFAAVAFTGPKDLQPEYGLDGSTWRNVTNITPGEDTYECNDSNLVCTRSAANPSAPMVKEGTFIFHGE
ncbi:hypothetical protein J2X69_004029 [Algoriphagus sp. 4150]|uniref:hypothetical protein n=1 Tax=Algoriphagus sp. 4150 TaxID=2817756 RepID=UPI0028586C89|nr:hypothetical protein [Algoriphagus sp. 4150]MDR7131665.1 hypothetical protein [Algoriphagus sp. 4150]